MQELQEHDKPDEAQTFSSPGNFLHNGTKLPLKKTNKLLNDIDRNGYKCTGKPEPLIGNLAGYWSVRIDEKNRIVFRIEGDNLEIMQCGKHYRD